MNNILVSLLLLFFLHNARAAEIDYLQQFDRFLKTEFEQKIEKNNQKEKLREKKIQRPIEMQRERRERKYQREQKKFRFKQNQGNQFIKLDKQGYDLPKKAKHWACVYDSQSGLFWEVKTTDGSIRDYRKTFRWGGLGAPAKTKGKQYHDWDQLVNAANREALCGYRGWRMPNIKELKSLSSYYSQNKKHFTSKKSGNGEVFLNPQFFPTIQLIEYPIFWSSSPYADFSNYAWKLNFNYGYDGYNMRYDDYYVRLVRGGQ